MTYALDYILKPIESILQEVSSQEYAFVDTKIGEHIQTKDHRTQEV
jgi:hypothetical protein